MTLAWRKAISSDADLIASLNRRLIEDEGHDNHMTVVELACRLRGWMENGEYEAVLFQQEHATVAYALYSIGANQIHLRQFFVDRSFRRHGIGRQAITILMETVWPIGSRKVVECMAWNQAGLAFWHALGFQDRYVGLSLPLRAA